MNREGLVATAEPSADAQPRNPRHVRRVWFAAAVAVAAAVGGVGLWVTQRAGDTSTGGAPDVIYGLVPMTAGATDFALGDFPINAPGKDVQVLSVTPVMSPNVDYLGAYVVWPRDSFGNLVSGGPGFPLPNQKHRHAIDEVVPAAETSYIPPGQTSAEPLTVTVGFRLRSGVGAVNGVTITYRADGRTYRQNYAQAATGCVKPEPCPTDMASQNAVLRRYGLVRGS